MDSATLMDVTALVVCASATAGGFVAYVVAQLLERRRRRRDAEVQVSRMRRYPPPSWPQLVIGSVGCAVIVAGVATLAVMLLVIVGLAVELGVI